MSITAGLPLVHEKGHQKSFHQMDNDISGELQVFEAAGYYSGANEIYGANFTMQQKMMRSGGRMSLDIPIMSNKKSSIPSPTCHQKATKDEKKYKQPISPGGKLASFLNSLFNQTSSKNKKSKISLDSKSSSFYSSSSSSELKTPPYNANTPTNNTCNDFAIHSKHNPDVMVITTLSKSNNINVHVKSSSSSPHKKVFINEKTENSWLDEEKFKFTTSDEFSSEKYNNFINEDVADKINYLEETKNFRNFVNGADSDSSSDLFELQNFYLVSCYSSDLPVYKTTHIHSIKRGAQIASGVI